MGYKKVKEELEHPISIILAVFLILFAVFLTLHNLTLKPTFIDDFKTGKVSFEDISDIYILKFDQVEEGWPFTKSDYDKKESERLASKKQLNELIKILTKHSTNGFIQSNHPATMYRGIFKIRLNNNHMYYIMYDVLKSKGGLYTELDISPSDEPNLNNGKVYGNYLLVTFLEQNDPWYRDLYFEKKKPHF
jgi:hypothetical protein